MLEILARLGYASKAVIYGIVGVFAIMAATNRGGSLTDTSGALRIVLTQPFGRILLVVLAVGLCGYAAWRLLDSVADPDRDGTDPPGLLTRVGNGIRGCVYGTLGIEAVRLLRGLEGTNGNEAELWTARILKYPFGEIAVAAVAVAIAMYGVFQIVEGVRGTHDEKLDWSAVSSSIRATVRRISRFGVAVRGGLLVTFGVFLARAAFTHNPAQAAGSRESLIQLAGIVEGRWWLLVIAAGVIAYAVDQAAHARCRRIRAVV